MTGTAHRRRCATTLAVVPLHLVAFIICPRPNWAKRWARTLEILAK